jgi:two-component system, chemotaxis family, protein-glutamate methylesterase/glutaminase
MTRIKLEAVVIGASAGALDALSSILPALSCDFPLPILVVVHVPPDKRSVMAELFRAKCHLRVEEAEDKQPIEPGTIYFAPPDYHLLIEVNKTVALSSDEPVLFSRPSIDVLFETAADAYGPALVAIILTGANHDGARGMQAVSAAGGLAIVQDPVTAFASTMPEAAIEMCPAVHVMSLAAIAEYLKEV